MINFIDRLVNTNFIFICFMKPNSSKADKNEGEERVEKKGAGRGRGQESGQTWTGTRTRE